MLTICAASAVLALAVAQARGWLFEFGGAGLGVLGSGVSRNAVGDSVFTHGLDLRERSLEISDLT